MDHQPPYPPKQPVRAGGKERVQLGAPGVTEPKWTVRRRLVLGIILWCILLVTYLAIWGKPDDLREAIATTTLMLLGMVVSTYLLGVVWNDMSFLKHTKGDPNSMGYGGYPPNYGGYQHPVDPTHPDGGEG